jgi:hypothetical protein
MSLSFIDNFESIDDKIFKEIKVNPNNIRLNLIDSVHD